MKWACGSTWIGLQPGDDRESALIETVGPGTYTAIVRGKDNTTGVGLVEVYNVPSRRLGRAALVSAPRLQDHCGATAPVAASLFRTKKELSPQA